jgi:glyoxylase-like metal-dependent hydrolase (beta-lactamase superfamily II)
MITIKSFVCNSFQENTYILHDVSGETAIIDPGCHNQTERLWLKKYIEEHALKPKYLLNTHCHIDHVLGNQWVKQTFAVPLLIPELEQPVLKAAALFAETWGVYPFEESEADRLINEKDELYLGDSQLKILFVPGHSPGHVAFYQPQQHFCIGGDVLFRQSIGRTDLPGGNHAQLLRSIREKCFTLDENTVFYPGHGPETTVGYEKKHNPFLN